MLIGVSRSVDWSTPLVTGRSSCILNRWWNMSKQHIYIKMATYIFRNTSILGTDYLIRMRIILQFWGFTQGVRDHVIFYNFFIFYSLPAVVGRCSHLEPVHHRCPYRASKRPSSTHHPVVFSINLWLNVFYITLRLLVAVPQEEVSKKPGTTRPCPRRAKPSSSPRPG